MIDRQFLTDFWHRDITHHAGAADIESVPIFVAQLGKIPEMDGQGGQIGVVLVCSLKESRIVLWLIGRQHGFVVHDGFALGLGVPVAADGGV